MLNKIRHMLGSKLMKMASEYAQIGGFKNIDKSLKLLKLAVRIVPPSNELTEFGEKLKELAIKTQQKIDEP